MTPEQIEYFQRELEIDFAISEPGLGRFRVAIFYQRGYPAMVLRYITADMPGWTSSGCPDVLTDLAMMKRGLILMVGATGSGKSTTLAAMINHRNEKCSDHIVTIEDPIEFLHTNKRSIINQREVGLDTKSYERALRGVMRAAPDVILIGEIRDRESMQAAINLSGTGHLVLATLHANNCAETLDRIINMFPHDQHKQVTAGPVAVPARDPGAAPGAGQGPAARGGGRSDAQHAAHLRTGQARRRRRHQGIDRAQRRARHPELRRRAAQALSGRPHHARRGAGTADSRSNLEAKINFG